MFTVHRIGFVLVFMMATPIYAQNPALSDVYMNPVASNPAMAGTAITKYDHFSRFTFNYRQTLLGLPGQTISTQLNSDINFKKLGLSMGPAFAHHELKQYNKNIDQLSAFFSYFQPYNRTRLLMRFALQPGILLQSPNFFTNPNNQIQVQELPNNSGQKRPVFFLNMGATAYTFRYFISVSFHNLLPGNGSAEKELTGVWPTLGVHAGYKIYIKYSTKKGVIIKPLAGFQIQSNQWAVQSGVLASTRALHAGLIYKKYEYNNRKYDVIVPIIGLNIRNIKFLYTADISNINLSNQISLIYRLDFNTRVGCFVTTYPGF